MRPRLDRWLLGFAALIVGASHAATSRADEAVEGDARAAYDEGAKAYEAHDFPRAARLFAHADELAPNPLVLKLALAAVTQADEPVLGMTLVLRAEARAVDGSLAELGKRARSRFEGRAAILRVVCANRGACHAAVGDKTYADGELVVVAPGSADATFTEGARSARARVTAEAKKTTDLVEPPFAAEAPREAPPTPALATPPREASGLAPAFFFGGAALTAVVGGGALASGLDTAAQHRAFERDPSADARDRGQSAELRTNVLLGATVVCAVVTGVVGVFFTRWHSAATPTSGRAPFVTTF